MNILLACEQSQIVTEAFTKKGHYVMSCDLLHPGAKGLPHYQGDVRDVLYDPMWDMLIGHPPCTRLTNAVIWYIHRHKLYAEVEEAARFFNMLLNAPIKLIGLENPVHNPIAKQYIRQHDQLIQPNWFGDDASKATCLWLKGLPHLYSPAPRAAGRVVNGRRLFANQTDSGQNRLAPDKKNEAGMRAKLRSVTYQGIANAMADQWSTPNEWLQLINNI